jgi:hypothetical protein
MYAYSVDVYLVSDPTTMSVALAVAPEIYRKVGLRKGWGPGKTELIFPPHCDPEAFLQQLDVQAEGLPLIVPGFNDCLGVPHHVTNDPEFIAESLHNLEARHDRPLDLVEDVADEDPLAALRLLIQVCGVQPFGHIINGVPPTPGF